jgi:hypothetical protein
MIEQRLQLLHVASAGHPTPSCTIGRSVACASTACHSVTRLPSVCRRLK